MITREAFFDDEMQSHIKKTKQYAPNEYYVEKDYALVQLIKYNVLEQEKAKDRVFLLAYEKDMNAKREYYPFNSVGEIEKMLLDVEVHNLSFHEVINGKQKIYVDFDMDRTEHAKITTQEFKLLISAFSKKCIEIFKDIYDITLDPKKDMILCETLGMEDKYSCHFIIDNYYVNNHKENEYFVDTVRKAMKKPIYAKIMDMGVYRKNKNLRLMYNFKRKRPYFFKQLIINKKVHKFANTLITYTDYCKGLPKLDSTLLKPTKSIIKIEIEIDEELLTFLLEDRGLSIIDVKSKGDIAYVEVERPYYCKICEKEHESMQPYIRSSKNGDIHYVCPRAHYHDKPFPNDRILIKSTRLIRLTADNS